MDYKDSKFYRYANSARRAASSDNSDSDPMRMFNMMFGSVREPKKVLVEGRDYEVIE